MLWKRVTFGLLMISLMLLGGVLDEWLDGLALPMGFRGFTRDGTWPPATVTLPVVAAVSAMASRELARMLRAKQIPASTVFTCGMSLVGVLLVGAVPNRGSAFGGAVLVNTATGLVVLGAMSFYSRGQRVKGSAAAAGGALLAFCYFGLLLGFLVAIRREHSVWVLLSILLIAKSCDIGAYFTGKYLAGRVLGRHRMIEWLSPKKTWEGLGGGVLLSVIVAVCSAVIFGLPPGMPVWAAAVLGVLLAVLGQAGDLAASLIKRDAGQKDAGGSVPGFGGVIDVIDSIVLVAPAAYWLLRVARLLGD